MQCPLCQRDMKAEGGALSGLVYHCAGGMVHRHAVLQWTPFDGTFQTQSKSVAAKLQDLGFQVAHTGRFYEAVLPAPQPVAAPEPAWTSSAPDVALLKPATPAPPDPEELGRQIRPLLEQGRLIDAIKLYRQLTDADLLEAKNAVDEVARGIAAEPTGMVPGLANEVEKQIRQLLQQERKVDAIKVYRRHIDAGLAEAKHAVDEIEHSMRDVGRDKPTTTAPEGPAEWENQIRQLLEQGRKIDAIKVYRQHTYVGLAEAKHAVDEIERGM
ncbi:MAG: hypothetical protein KKA73_30995 [Chloroflexi bacterium]|nr:hypothetical protein [Chloroflexota bacterium]MBU1752130.1 hypothetical protein [Chloroflexota bacterium]